MSIEKGLLSEQDFNFGVGTFERKGRTGFPITVNQVSDLIAGTTGPIIDARRFTLFTDAVSAAVGKTLLIAGAVSLPAGVITIPTTVSVLPLQGGVISKGSATSLTINGPVVGNPMHQWLSGFAVGEVTFGVGSIYYIIPQWLGAGINSSAAINGVALNIAIGMSATFPCIISGGGIYQSDIALLVPADGQVFGVGFPILKATANMDYLLGTASGTKTHIKGFVLDGNNFATSTFYGYLLLENARIEQIRAYGGVARNYNLVGCQVSEFIKLTSHSPAVNGFLLEGCNASVFSRLRAIDGTGEGIIVSNLASPALSGGCIIKNADVEGNDSHGILLDTNTTPTTVEGCWIEGNSGDGINVNSDGNTIYNNRCTGLSIANKYGVRITSGNTGNKVRDNVLASYVDNTVKNEATGLNIVGSNFIGDSGTSYQFPEAKSIYNETRSRQIQSPTISAGALIVDLDLGDTIYVTVTENITAINFPVGTQYNFDANIIHFIFLQDGTGGRTIAGWEARYKLTTWSNTGNTANKISTISFVRHSTTDTWIQLHPQVAYF